MRESASYCCKHEHRPGVYQVPTKSGNIVICNAIVHTSRASGLCSSTCPGLAASCWYKDLQAGSDDYSCFVRAAGRHGYFCLTGALQTRTPRSPPTTMFQAGWSCNRCTAMVRTKGPPLGQGPQGWSRQGWGRRGPWGCAEDKLWLGEVGRIRGKDLIALSNCPFFPSQP